MSSKIIQCIAYSLGVILITSSSAYADTPRAADKKKFDPHRTPIFFSAGDQIDVDQAIKNIDARIGREPNVYALQHIKAELYMSKGNTKLASVILKDLIAKQIKLKKRYPAPYFDLAMVYEETNQKAALVSLMKDMIERFPDDLHTVKEVDRINGKLKIESISLKTKAAQKKLATASTHSDNTLESLRPPNPIPLKKSECYKLLVTTKCFPRFRLFFTNAQCLADSGVARYLIAPPDYKMMTFFDPESERYAVVPIAEVMENHCRDKGSQKWYTSVKKIGKATVRDHQCTKYQCLLPGGDNFDIVYLSDSIKIDDALMKPMSQVYQIPIMGCVPMKIDRYVEDFSMPVLSVASYKQVPIPESTFSIPKSAKKVDSINDVIFDKDLVDTMFK